MAPRETDTSETAVDDRDLLAAFAGGHDERAFDELVRRHARLVRAVCSRALADPADADDAAQAVFIALARQARDLIDHPTLAGWLHRAAFNIASKVARQNRRRKVRHDAAARSHPAGAAAPRRERPEIHAALEALPEKYRLVLVLHYFDGLTKAAIADRIGIGESGVSMRLSRGRDLLKRKLRAPIAQAFAGVLGATASRDLPRWTERALHPERLPRGSSAKAWSRFATAPKARLLIGGLATAGFLLVTLTVWLADGRSEASAAVARPADPPAPLPATELRTVAPTRSGIAYALLPDGDFVCQRAVSDGDGGVFFVGFRSKGLLFDAPVFHLDANGRPVAAFGQHGARIFPEEGCTSVARQSDGRLVMLLDSRNVTALRVVRVNADGGDDASFAGGAPPTCATTNQPLPALMFPHLMVDQRDRIWIFRFDPQRASILERLTPDGAPDPGFGSGGRIVVTRDQAICAAIVADPNGGVYLAGTGWAGRPKAVASACLLHVREDGALDPAFGVDGFSIFTNPDIAMGLLDATLLPDGGLVAGGDYAPSENIDRAWRGMALWYNPRGTFDSSREPIQLETPPAGAVRQVALQADGKVLMLLRTDFQGSGPGKDVVVLRRMPDGSPDRGFGEDGIVVIHDSGLAFDPVGLRPTPGGIEIFGRCGRGGRVGLFIARLRDDGRPADFGMKPGDLPPSIDLPGLGSPAGG